MLKTIRDIQYFEGVKALVCVDFNVPMVNGRVTEDFRLRKSLPTINFLREKGAKVILMSHASTDDGKELSLEPVTSELQKMGLNVRFVQKLDNAHETIEKGMKNGDVILLENLRFDEGEKKNDAKFAKALASLADIYVNEAFPMSHRAHASIVGVPKYMPSYAGLQFEKEVTNLTKAFNPVHPFIFILGGAKFSTKIPLIDKFMNSADTIFIGGALANDFYKAKGFEVGQSKVSEIAPDLSHYLNNEKVIIPPDVIDTKQRIWSANGFPKGEKIMDDGPETLKVLKEKIAGAKFILWNGPLGVYELGFQEPTHELARMIGEATMKNGAISIVGGGDTVAAISKLGIEDQFTFVSTGGGAMLDFLAEGTLPGIRALEECVA